MSVIAGLLALAAFAGIAVDLALLFQFNRRTAARLEELGRRLDEIEAERERFLGALRRHLAAADAERKDNNGTGSS